MAVRAPRLKKLVSIPEVTVLQKKGTQPNLKNIVQFALKCLFLRYHMKPMQGRSTGCGWYAPITLYCMDGRTNNSPNTAYLHCWNCNFRQIGRTNVKINATPLQWEGENVQACAI